MYIGRDFKRDLELDSLNIDTSELRTNRSWIDFFKLSLSYNYFDEILFDYTDLIDCLSEDEVIILDSHDDVFKEYQIHYWRKDRISDILPAIKCPSFKPETKIFKTSEIDEMKNFIFDHNHAKSIVMENTDEKLFINFVYGDTLKIIPRGIKGLRRTNYFDKLKERYKLWEIDDCVCKPKKIRIWEDDCFFLKYDIEEHVRISNINDIKVGVYDWGEDRDKMYSNSDTIVFNHLSKKMSDNETNFIFLGDSLTVVEFGNSYNFRLDQRTKESEYSYIDGKI